MLKGLRSRGIRFKDNRLREVRAREVGLRAVRLRTFRLKKPQLGEIRQTKTLPLPEVLSLHTREHAASYYWSCSDPCIQREQTCL